jgi:hypothetical protein
MNRKIYDKAYTFAKKLNDARGADAQRRVVEELEAYLDSLTVLEVSAEDWAAHPEAKGAYIQWTICALEEMPYALRAHYIPRPARVRLTDAEIEEKAVKIGIDAIRKGLESVNTTTQEDYAAGILVALAEKARLEALP